MPKEGSDDSTRSRPCWRKAAWEKSSVRSSPNPRRGQSIPDSLRSRRPVRSIVTSALIAAAALDVLLFFYYLKATIIRLPYSDMYWYVVRYLQFREDGEWWSYVWAPHVQHHPVWTRLLIALDVEAFSGAVYPIVAFAVICQLTTAWLLWQNPHRLCGTCPAPGNT